MLTDLNLKSNDNNADHRFCWPIISAEVMHDGIETEIYARFMRHMRNVPNKQHAIKVLSSIQFSADMMDISDALVAKILVDMGLRAPRCAFPGSYLEHADSALMRSGWDVGHPGESLLALKKHWDHIGEDRFAAFRRQHSLPPEAGTGKADITTH